MPDLLCTSPSHPFGVFYRLQKLNEDSVKSAMLCPWCDWMRLYEVHEGGVVYTKIPDPYYKREEYRAALLMRAGPHPNEKRGGREPGEMRNMEERIDDFETEAEMDRLAEEKEEEPHA